jgi:Zn-dependent peptidase ImmA (M78 family)
LIEEDGETPVSGVPAVDSSVKPEQAARIARAALAVPLKDQFAWRLPEDALAGWQQAVEDLGVLVLRTSEVSMAEMRGFSLGAGAVPVIVLNALDAPRGQVFTLAHEFAHLMLHEGGICDLLEPSAGSARTIETWCNATAGAVLMPAKSFLDNEVVGPTGRRTWDEETLSQLSHRYGVSKEAVLRRLVTLERATWEFYLTRREEYLAAYEEQREEERARRRSSKGGPPPHRMAIRDRGKPYVRLVLDAYHRDTISPSSLSNLLGLKLKHIQALEREAGPS